MTGRSLSRIDGENRTAIGAFFVLATLSSSAGVILLDPVLDHSDLLAGVAAEETQVMLGAFLLLVNSIALVIIAVPLYPILKDHNAPPAVMSRNIVLER